MVESIFYTLELSLFDGITKKLDQLS